VSRCKILAKSDDQQLSYSDLTIFAFGDYFGGPFVPTDLGVGGTHTHPVGTVRYAHHLFLTGFFVDFQRSLTVRNGSALNRTGLKIWDFLPPIKIWDDFFEFLLIFLEFIQGCHQQQKNDGRPLG